MGRDIENYNESIFESIKHINKYGEEIWYARELQTILGYKQWRSFYEVIEKAKTACEHSDYAVSDHFADVGKIVEAGVSKKSILDIMLTRYACYLIVQNGDPRKKMIALGQTYFAIQTRKQELQEEDFRVMTEDERRLHLRNDVKGFNKKLATAAQDAGVRNFGKFQNCGYQGLYNGETAADIKDRKGLKKGENILDHMGSTELAANYFRITQTEEKLRREQIKGENNANNTHYYVGQKVRQTIKDLGGTMPEDLPTPEKSIKQIEKEHKRFPKK
ncbi:DNA damage-inducible protein D [Anaerotignum lactatifermentans]|uniref:DNA damage-inducible protein D n=1 Tax=Anaerotignum lactatifermentans TaxID=160404 RepID=A0ABS2GCM3_9FIRM|nr:DNA damage-inducible protein D [Anaerotignum lactatifermentans]MBM6830355.1 DNA damage-inducible protein D [Anaerotignum lactatifermentans]MBM6878900.1 DNA damage-inducible protein D [Anaerotignum lactatifermentans]MBM6951916.1 DNA damage-inducible protein D [Anaerotignum lactatifermentans]